MWLWMLLACGEQDDPDPADLCRAEGTAECCSDDECADGSICHFVYTCTTRGGRWDCSEPVGTNLLDATQAEAMVRHMMEGMPEV